MNDIAKPAGPVATVRNGSLAASSFSAVVPVLVASIGDQASWRYVEFFTANIRNPNTRRAYARACSGFLAWCDERGLILGSRGQSVGCHVDNAKGERSGNVGHATILPCPNLSGRRRSAVAAARSHRKSPEKPMCSHVSGDVWASSSSGTGRPWFRRCCTASAM